MTGTWSRWRWTVAVTPDEVSVTTRSGSRSFPVSADPLDVELVRGVLTYRLQVSGGERFRLWGLKKKEATDLRSSLATVLLRKWVSAAIEWRERVDHVVGAARVTPRWISREQRDDLETARPIRGLFQAMMAQGLGDLFSPVERSAACSLEEGLTALVDQTNDDVLGIAEDIDREFFAQVERRELTSDAVIPGDEVKLGERWLLKLHGTLGGELVFTRSDYISSSSSHSALRGIVQAMLLTRHMLFVGYSLRDDDFHQLVHEVRTALGDQQRTLGTALLVRDNEHLPTLWPEIDVVSTGGGADAGRRVALFLDLMASTAASSITFVADDSFGELRSDHETRLNDVVKELAALHDEVRGAGDGGEWPEVESFLGHFGKHR